MPAAGILISAVYEEGRESSARALPRACSAARVSRTGTQGLPGGQAGLGVGRACLRGGGQAVIVIPATDLAGGTGSVRDRQASAYQGVPAGSLRCASEERSHGDKFQPGLT